MGNEGEKMTLETTTRPLVEVRTYLDELLGVDGFDAAGNGLQISAGPSVGKVGLAVNCSLQVIEGAAERSCDLLITHHAAWPSTDAHLADGKAERLHELAISHYAAHDCLDCAREFGTADALARAVRVAVQGAFEPDGTSPSGVHGMTIGSWSDLRTRVSSQLGAPVRAWKNTESFGHVAIVPGWGGRPEWMARAQALGCDTFLTGEAIMFGMLFAKETGMNLLLAGHQATETPGMLALSARISRDLRLEVTFIPEDMVESKA